MRVLGRTVSITSVPSGSLGQRGNGIGTLSNKSRDKLRFPKSRARQ
jgi:hypothetical protein